MYEQGITANVGDYYRMLFLGSMENKYSPKHALAEDVNEQYELAIATVKALTATGDITEDQQKELLEKINETKKKSNGSRDE